MPTMTKQEVVELLRSFEISPTSQRVEIAHYLFNSNGHMSADQILEGVNQEYPAVSRGTVYNALNVLVEKSLIREVIAAPGKVFYCPSGHPHHHVYYVDREELMDLPEELVDISGLARMVGTPAERMDLVVRVRG